jgi:hypothetical protein
LFPEDNDEAVRVLPSVEFALSQLYSDHYESAAGNPCRKPLQENSASGKLQHAAH